MNDNWIKEDNENLNSLYSIQENSNESNEKIKINSIVEEEKQTDINSAKLFNFQEIKENENQEKN